MRELNLKQVRNALEHCINNDFCDGCPIGVSKCHIIEDSLSLIKELAEENKAWQMQLIDTKEKAGKAYYELACEVEDLRAENARLHASCTELTRKCASLTEENEGLRKHNAVLIEDNHILSSECIPMAKADTVRKMQERLKQALYNKQSLFTQQRYIVDEVIDQIAKEMLEEA